MNWIVTIYLAYLAISVALTVWVARTPVVATHGLPPGVGMTPVR
jgi:hypothetical protein